MILSAFHLHFQLIATNLMEAPMGLSVYTTLINSFWVALFYRTYSSWSNNIVLMNVPQKFRQWLQNLTDWHCMMQSWCMCVHIC